MPENIETNVNAFEKTEIFKKEIEPLLRKIRHQCSMYDIPMFFAACVADDGENSKYIKELVSPQSHSIKLSTDYFPGLVAVTLGFNVVPPMPKPEFTYDTE